MARIHSVEAVDIPADPRDLLIPIDMHDELMEDAPKGGPIRDTSIPQVWWLSYKHPGKGLLFRCIREHPDRRVFRCVECYKVYLKVLKQRRELKAADKNAKLPALPRVCKVDTHPRCYQWFENPDLKSHCCDFPNRCNLSIKHQKVFDWWKVHAEKQNNENLEAAKSINASVEGERAAWFDKPLEERLRLRAAHDNRHHCWECNPHDRDALHRQWQADGLLDDL